MPLARGLDELAPDVYQSLRAAAHRMMSTERPDHTLQPTALVHEAFLRLAKQSTDWGNRTDLQLCAARIMRQILVNHAHARAALRRGGGRMRADDTVDALMVRQGHLEVEMLDLDAALQELEVLDPRQHRVVQLRYFAGLSSSEVARSMGISARTVQREWRMAQAWLREWLRSDEDG